MIVIDTLARTLTSAEIPVGIITALLGAPIFTLLLLKTYRKKSL
ncbi:iron chelate uptake ABC transporter family permease subunit [Pasteurella multocida]|nr:iron complex transport system permease [Pasteurella multocida]